jgi:hypothetical protein
MRITNLAVSAILFANVCSLAADHPPATDREALRALELAEAGASGMHGIDRAYAYWLISRDYSGLDNKAQLEAAKKSCESAIRAEPEASDPGLQLRVERDSLQLILTMQPKKGEELLAQADPLVRQWITADKAAGVASKGDIDKALDMLAQDISQSSEYPYSQAMNVMRTLPASDRENKDRVFAQALTYYRVKNDKYNITMFDLGAMVEKFWRDLSPGLVLEAIDAILDSAESEATADFHQEISLSSSKGAAGFGSIYQYRAFQLMPALNALDPSRAKKIMENFQQMADLQKQFPDGLSMLGEDSTQSISLGIKKGPATSAADSGEGLGQIRLEARAEKIIADAGDDMDSALKNALALPDNLQAMQSVKADLLLRIATLAQKAHPSKSMNALHELANVIKDYPPLAQSRYLVEMADLYLRMKEKDAATNTIERGLKQMVLLYKIDTNSDDPNKALKSSWPSTVVSRALVSLATRVSTKLSEDTIKQAPDPDFQVFDRIEVASALLKTPSYPALMHESHKDNKMSYGVFPIPSVSQ